MNKLTQQREHFNAVAGRYQEARRHANHQHLKRLLWRYVFARSGLRLKAGAQVLEAMCGYAEGRKIIFDNLTEDFDYSGFDYSDVVVASVRDQCPELNVFWADATTFEAASSYDLIFLIGGLHHVPDHAGGVVSRLASALNPGGCFVSFEPTSGNRLFGRIREAIYRRNSLFDAETERAFEVPELLSWFEKAGLRQVFVTYPGLLTYTLYYNPDAFPALNLGSTRTVENLFRLEEPIYHRRIARMLSFATLSVWRRQ